MMTLSEAHALVAATVAGVDLVGDGRTSIERVHTDTRTLRPGDLFVALRGDRFDAHDFIDAALHAGASAVMAERGAFPQGLRVPDTQAALEALSLGWRRRLSLPLIAVTGSNGKTTVTQMIAGILRAWQGAMALATEGNFNNHIGVPLTLLRLRQDGEVQHRVAVLELGMNHPGEIARLAQLAKPTVALVNNAQREHQEFMDGVEAVARENGSVITALPAQGVAVFPAEDVHAPLWRELAGSRRVLTFGQGSGADVRAEGAWDGSRWQLVLHTPHGDVRTNLDAPGVHNVLNAAAAAACALAAGAPLDAVSRGLSAFVPVKGRLQRHRIVGPGRNLTLIDDSYNANPDSVRAAIDVLASMPGPRWLVLGDMGEVGEQGAAFHREVGAYARERGVDALWVAGPLAVHAARAFGDATAFTDAVAMVASLGRPPACASVLVKGSRFMGMERVVKALQASSQQRGPDAA